MATLNFLDLAKANSNEIVGDLIEDVLNASPELGVFDSEDLGLGQLSYETLHRTALPSVSFADAGEGFTPTKSEISLLKHECFRFGGRVEAARHIADNWRRGGAGGYQAHEASGILESSLKLIGRQIWYGRSYDGKGFPGIKAFTPKGGEYTFDATGADVGVASSVYAVKFGEKYARLMVGQAKNGSGLIDLPDFRIGDAEDANGKKFEAYISELSSYVGLQIAAPYSVARICNLGTSNGKTLNDVMLGELLFKFPAGFVPDAIFMSRRSRKQLQASRTVTLFGQGKDRPNQPILAPLPTEYEGIPIVVTDNILDTDAVE